MKKRSCLVTVAAILVLWVLNRPAKALPTMIRLGYGNCAVCHISPQGGGLLNAYGRSIDQAQSLRAGEYRPSENRFVKWLNWDDRITQDLRSVVQEQLSATENGPLVGKFRARFMYRNATELGKGFRISAVVNGENDSVRRPALSYEPPIRPREVYITSALLSFRPAKTLEFSAGRDQLPSGVNIPDLAFFIRSRNRLGYYDAPLQFKVFWWGKHYHINPYAFAPGGTEPAGDKESGGGSLAEFDLLGKGTTIVGINALRGVARNTDRTLVGPYARLGFGKWGILAEHDITDRKVIVPSPAHFLQHTSYAQLFWYPREWLVASVIGEQLQVQRPFAERLVAGRFEVTSRFSNHITLGINTRVQRDTITGQLARSVALQLTLKTVQ